MFDTYLAHFKSILQDARTIIQSDRVQKAKQCQKTLGSDFKLIMPIFAVIMYRRDPDCVGRLMVSHDSMTCKRGPGAAMA